MTIQLGRRQFLMGTSALLAAGMAGISPAWAQSALRLIFWGGQARADRTYAVTDLYEAAGNAGVESEFLSWNDYWPKLATQTAGGTAPDIIQMDYRYIVEYATRNAIAPIDDIIGDLGEFDADQLEGGKVDGKLYGISLGANSVATLANKKAIEEIGETVPDNSWTYADLERLGEAFKAAGNGMVAFSDGSGTEPMLDNWVRQRGKSLYTADGKLGFTADDMVEWFTMWNGFRDKGYIVDAETQALDTGAPESSMVAMKKAAMMPSNSNQLVIHQSINDDELTITSYPRIAPGVGGGHYRKPSMFFSVGGSSADKEAAAAFINFFVTNPEAGAVLGVERGIPCNAAVREAITPTLDAQSQIALNFVANLGDLVGALPPSPPAAAGEIDLNLLRVISQEVAFGARSPEDAGQYFVDEATAILNRAAS
ncbi:extracellular solute-binding protein [Devosia sp. XJ19-1]|uniref:Extracellular solute-binding protein n=1 Tax=Devosia ureilytica TaxID=2952754 RepID=A0A9Q4AMY1_9HYPH|nr:extracellular solute-binding protein [Devosia ureilytica]MCP8883099.1 extracellular solute-binding protein [Devosia ureilytica]MCP8886533.1 extracellular solute-binding protein [Devosia ureilytica]